MDDHMIRSGKRYNEILLYYFVYPWKYRI